MCDFFDWDRDDEDRQDAHRRLKDAMALKFNHMYGTDVDDLNLWKNLCEILQIVPIPDELKACRDVCSSSNASMKKTN